MFPDQTITRIIEPDETLRLLRGNPAIPKTEHASRPVMPRRLGGPAPNDEVTRRFLDGLFVAGGDIRPLRDTHPPMDVRRPVKRTNGVALVFLAVLAAVAAVAIAFAAYVEMGR